MQLPGQTWTPKDQCQLLAGANAGYCYVRTHKMTFLLKIQIVYNLFRLNLQSTLNQVCDNLFCRNSTDSSCLAHSARGAAEGTSCGSGKVN